MAKTKYYTEAEGGTFLRPEDAEVIGMSSWHRQGTVYVAASTAKEAAGIMDGFGFHRAKMRVASGVYLEALIEADAIRPDGSIIFTSINTYNGSAAGRLYLDPSDGSRYCVKLGAFHSKLIFNKETV